MRIATAKPGRRQQEAAETRRLVIDAARRLFAAQGYGATAIAQIAREAGVAVPTIYASVGTKLHLLELLNDRIDDEAGVDSFVPALRACRDPDRMLALQVRLSRRLNERCGDLIRILQSAATVEPAMAGPYAEGMRRHREGARATAERLASLGALATGVSTADAAALLDALLAPPSWTTLTVEHGLSFEGAEVLLLQTLGKVLFGRPPSVAAV